MQPNRMTCAQAPLAERGVAVRRVRLLPEHADARVRRARQVSPQNAHGAPPRRERLDLALAPGLELGALALQLGLALDGRVARRAVHLG